MKQLFLTSTPDQVYTLKEQAGLIYAGFKGYLDYLSTKLEVLELPRAIVWTDYQTASQTISDIPIPAYTNDYRTVMSPQIDIWEEIYLSQLKGIKTDAFVSKKVRAYYARLSVNNVKQILGHEFVHWSNLFSDEAYEENRWFEEGMAEYISRKFFLTTAEYEEEKEINKMLVDCYEKCHGKTCLSEFTANTYTADYATVFHYYWKSFLKVEEIIDKQKGDIRTVIDRFNAGDIK
jgi:hypothetical protein